MPSCTRTPEQSRTTVIRHIAQRADTLAVLLASLEFMPSSEAQSTLAVCVPLATEVVECLARIVEVVQ